MKKLVAFVIILAMIMGQVTEITALAENASSGESRIRFDVEEGLSAEEYNQKKSEFVDQLNSAYNNTPAMYTSRSSVNGNLMSNEYIEFAVKPDNGRFTIGTVKGNPSLSTDDNKVMLYGHSNPRTSYTTIYVNGKSYIYGDNGFVTFPHFDSDTNYSEATFENISVQQEISIVENSSTQRDDIVEIKYHVTNTGNTTASFGLRVMLDTMLGSNDAAPFRIPGYGDLTTEKEFVDDDIPQYWQAFDDLNHPKVVSHGNFMSGSIRPNKVQFSNWRNVFNTPWGYKVSEGRTNGDSAVSVIWERSLAAGAQETYVTRYGLSELLQDLQPPLGVTIAAGSTILPNEKKDGYLSYPITIYVQNIGTATAHGVICTIDIPDGLVFAGTNKTTASFDLGDIEVGSVKTVEAVVYAQKIKYDDTKKHFSVTVIASQTEPKRLTKEFTIVPLDSEEIPVTEKNGTFKYAGFINQDKDSTAKYSYSDSYFDGDATIYNKKLATMSLCLELSTWSSWDGDPNNWQERSKNAYALLQEIGFVHVDRNDAWNQKPAMNSIGVITAHKNIGDATVVALAIRGGGYFDEWGGNFVLGNSGNHKGFEMAKNEALKHLENYINEHKSEFKDEVKIWIVGYSRGGAVANMTAGKLTKDKKCGGISLSEENIYAYTFEAPQGYVIDVGETYRNDNFSNIHNIVNVIDLVPYLAPKTYRFQRYNIDSRLIFPTLSIGNVTTNGTTEFGSKRVAINKKLKEVCEGIPGNHNDVTYEPNPYSMELNFKLNNQGIKWWGPIPYPDIDIQLTERNYKAPVDRMLSKNVNSIFDEIPERRAGYVKNIEPALTKLISFFMGYDNTIDWGKAIYDAFFADYAEGARIIVGILLRPYPFGSPEKNIKDATDAATQLIVDAALHQANTNLDEVKSALKNVLISVFNTVIDDPQQFFSFLYYLFADNGFQSHWPEVTLAAMMADEAADNTRSIDEVPYSYRIVQVNCPVDIVVYDESHQIFSQITGETVTNKSSTHGSSITEDGTKQIVLPSDAAYTIDIKATGDGEMSVSILEYNSVLQQHTLLHGWQNLPISTGDHFSIDIPAYAIEDYKDVTGNGSNTAYTMVNSTGQPIEATLHMTGNDIVYHKVTLSSNNQKGIVIGGGEHITSSFAQVQAIPLPTVEFLGWYQNGTCVSVDETYRFAVNHDTDLVAHFSEGNFHKLSVTATAGGTVNASEMDLPEGMQIQLTAEPDQGFEFDRWEVSSGNVENPHSPTIEFTMPSSNVNITAFFKNSNGLSIIQHPVDQYVVVGQSAIFTIGVVGYNVTYQWYMNRNDGQGWKKIDGAVGASYTTPAVELDCDGFQYYCEVRDQSANVYQSNVAVLHVSPLANPETPVFISQPQDQYVVVGQTATFSVQVAGKNLIYQWYVDRNNGESWKKIDGAVGTSYSTSAVDLDCDGFKYYCEVIDQYSNVYQSNVAVLHVSPLENPEPPVFISQPQDQYVVVGQKATFSIAVEGKNLIYQWYINRNNGHGWKKIDGAMDTSYTTSAVDLDCDGFQYYCEVMDQYSNAYQSNVATLHVSTAPVLPETGDRATPILWTVMTLFGALGILLIKKLGHSK